MITEKQNTISKLGKVNFTRRVVPTAKVISVTENQTDESGNITKQGAVTFINDVGSKCVMTIIMFLEMYE